MTTRKYHLHEQQISEGLQIYEDRLEVAGVSFRRAQAISFAKSTNVWLELERDEENEHDRNALKVIGCSTSFLGTRRRFIGYVPRDVAKRIVEGGFLEKISPRLLKTYVGESEFVEILFQILGPKGQKFQFNRPAPGDGGHYTEFVERVKHLKADGRVEEAIQLLLKLVGETEAEARAHQPGWGAAPWYYEQLAILYRKEQRYEDEVQILERYACQPKAPGAGPEKLADRLVKARQLRDSRRT
jgi:hypothetical protein